ncbi:MAG TPA: PD-(D/E)XK nuclease domain-containing protein [Candidatus Mediterraneibacter stercoripullorum]|nr:PD-(D/E)XK nuclease domain-containing protein [Candidatus Mediterraneibacter stercoripullorum]
MIVELEDKYRITSNRESGFGRYDVLIESKDTAEPAIIIEFKVQESEETALSETVTSALKQINEKNYVSVLTAHCVQSDKIRKYGFAFCGNKVLIGTETTK